MPSRCSSPGEDDAASVQTSLPLYMPRNHEAYRLLSPAPSYRTIELERIESVNEEQAIVPAQARRGVQSRTQSPSGKLLSEEENKVRVTMLVAGIFYQKTAVALLAILAGAQVNVQTETGISPLHCAALKGNIIMIKILLMRGADTEVEEEHGLTPLDLAVMQGHTKAVRLLISRGAKTDHLVVNESIFARSLRRRLCSRPGRINCQRR